MKVLVTGSNGQLGTELRQLAKQSKDSFLFTDAVSLDITDKAAVENFFAESMPDIVINCAAYTNVENAEDNYSAADKVNHLAVGYLSDACSRIGAFLVHVSTDYVFDGKHYTPYGEDAPTVPLGVYGRTKLDGEHAAMASGCRYLILRTAWLYSPYGKNFVKTIYRLSDERDSLNVVFDQIGTPTYAADLAAAIMHIITNRMFDEQGIFHFSNEGVCSWYDLAVAINELSGHSCRILPCHSDEFPSKVARPHYSVLDKTRFKETFGMKIPHWHDGLKRCMKVIEGK